MLYQSQIRWLLAALVLAAYTHCVYSHAIEAADWHQQVKSDEQPANGDRTTCENESACICKGATLATDVTVLALELSVVDTVCLSPVDCLPCLLVSFDRRILPDARFTPVSGGMLRAQLQRFLL